MRRITFALLLAAAACGGSEDGPRLDSTPLSVRGWIHDVANAKRGETVEVEIARRTALFTGASIWVENYEYASGGIAENGAFVVLDVPSGNPTLGFNVAGAETAKIVMENIPGNADVFIPDVILELGGAKVLDPSKIAIRVPASVDAPRRTGKTAKIAGYEVPITETPLHMLTDRRDYPNPGGFRPVAIVK
jgi:hypothetical protein